MLQPSVLAMCKDLFENAVNGTIAAAPRGHIMLPTSMRHMLNLR